MLELLSQLQVLCQNSICKEKNIYLQQTVVIFGT